MPGSQKTRNPAPPQDRNRPFLPYVRHEIDEQDISAVVDVLRGDWLTTGPAVNAFEGALAKQIDARHAVACSSGTAALHLAALSLGLERGDIAIIPAITFFATANAIRYTGAEVHFADIDPSTGLMGLEQLEDAWAATKGERVRAILPVHLAGQCVNPADIHAWAAERELKVVQDCAHSLGSTFRFGEMDIPAGSGRFADMSIYSFHPAKAVAMGEGGAVVTNSDGLMERLRQFRNHGMTRDPSHFVYPDSARAQDGSINPWYYEMEELGFNYRVTDVQCALGLSQLTKLNKLTARRRELVAYYDHRIASLQPLVRPLHRIQDCRPGWHLYVVRIDFRSLGGDRAYVMNRLRSLGVGSQVNFIPIYKQPYYRRRYGDRLLPGAEAYYSEALSIPLFPSMSKFDIDRVIDALEQVCADANSPGG